MAKCLLARTYYSDVASEKIGGNFALGQVCDGLAVNAQILESHVFGQVIGIAAGQ